MKFPLKEIIIFLIIAVIIIICFSVFWAILLVLLVHLKLKNLKSHQILELNKQPVPEKLTHYVLKCKILATKLYP